MRSVPISRDLRLWCAVFVVLQVRKIALVRDPFLSSHWKKTYQSTGGYLLSLKYCRLKETPLARIPFPRCDSERKHQRTGGHVVSLRYFKFRQTALMRDPFSWCYCESTGGHLLFLKYLTFQKTALVRELLPTCYWEKNINLLEDIWYLSSTSSLDKQHWWETRLPDVTENVPTHWETCAILEIPQV